jgi:hypothetical protein
MHCSGSSDLLKVESIFRCENVAHHQVATLGSAELAAEVITFACAGPWGPESADSSAIQVDFFVHCSTTIRRVSLEALLDPTQKPQISKFECKAVQTWKGRQYSCNPTVQKFLDESALDLSVAGKRQRIDLAGQPPVTWAVAARAGAAWCGLRGSVAVAVAVAGVAAARLLQVHLVVVRPPPLA